MGGKGEDSAQEMASWIDEKELVPVEKRWVSKQDQEALAPPRVCSQALTPQTELTPRTGWVPDTHNKGQAYPSTFNSHSRML